VKSEDKTERDPAQPITIRLPLSVIARFEAEARQRGLSRSEYVRVILLDVKPSQEPPQQGNPRDPAEFLEIVHAVNRAGRSIEIVARAIDRAAKKEGLTSPVLDTVVWRLASVDAALREGLNVGCKN